MLLDRSIRVSWAMRMNVRHLSGSPRVSFPSQLLTRVFIDGSGTQRTMEHLTTLR